MCHFNGSSQPVLSKKHKMKNHFNFNFEILSLILYLEPESRSLVPLFSFNRDSTGASPTKYIWQVYPPQLPIFQRLVEKHFPGWWSLVSICTMPARALAEEMAEHGCGGTLGADVAAWKERGVINEFTLALRLFAWTVRHKDAARWHNNDLGCWWWPAARIPDESRCNLKNISIIHRGQFFCVWFNAVIIDWIMGVYVWRGGPSLSRMWTCAQSRDIMKAHNWFGLPSGETRLHIVHNHKANDSFLTHMSKIYVYDVLLVIKIILLWNHF